MPESKASWEISSQEVSFVAPDKLRLTKELLSFLVRTLKTMLLYPQNNPIPGEFRKNLYEKLANFLDEYEELCLIADQGKLLLSGELVHEDSAQEEGIALCMYRDGIREITFTNGLKMPELEGFLEAFKTALQSRTSEDDLVTLLWEKDFLHIKYTVVEQASDLSDPVLIESTGKGELEKIFYSEISLSEQEMALVQPGEPLIALDQTISEEISRLLQNVSSFQKEEVAEINTLLQIEKFYRHQAEVIPIMFEILLGEEEQTPFNETMGLIEKLLEEFVAKKQYALAAEGLTRLRKEEEYLASHSKAKSDRVRASMERLGDKDHLEKIAQVLNQEKEQPSQDFYHYLVLLSTNALPNLLAMLGELKLFSGRKLLCQVLEFFAHKHMEQVAAGLSDRRWYVVRNVAMVLGRTKNPKITVHLRKILKHADFRVRKEAILALSRLGHPEASALLVQSLQDADRKIRMYALRALAASKEKSALEPLWEQVNSRDFYRRGADEIKECFEAIVLIGEEKGLEYVFRFIKRFHLLNRGLHNEHKLLALESLEKSSNPNLAGYLEQISSSGSRSLRNAARMMLDHLEARSKKSKGEPDDLAS